MQRETDAISALPELTLSWPERNQASLLAAIEQFGLAHSLPQALRYRLGLIVDELVTNFIVHGACPGKNQTLWISIVDREKELLLEIIDTGLPFDPTNQPFSRCPEGGPVPIGGIGLCLVRHLADWIQYTRSKDRNHLLLSLTKAKQVTACSSKK